MSTESNKEISTSEHLDDISQVLDTRQLASFTFQEFDSSDPAKPLAAENNEAELNVRIELGRTELDEKELARLQLGSVVTLKQSGDDPVDIFVDERLIGRGEVLLLNECFCVRLIELLMADN